ncbi:hypothetical protein LINPERPRIM_LOCUS9051 [Linum perenne]
MKGSCCTNMQRMTQSSVNWLKVTESFSSVMCTVKGITQRIIWLAEVMSLIRKFTLSRLWMPSFVILLCMTLWVFPSPALF